MDRTLGDFNMKIGDLVTWKINRFNESLPREYGVVIGFFNGKTSLKDNKCVWVKFANGQHAYRERTLCAIQQLDIIKEVR